MRILMSFENKEEDWPLLLRTLPSPINKSSCQQSFDFSSKPRVGFYFKRRLLLVIEIFNPATFKHVLKKAARFICNQTRNREGRFKTNKSLQKTSNDPLWIHLLTFQFEIEKLLINKSLKVYLLLQHRLQPFPHTVHS
jgi:hypothetical protein